MKLSSLRKTRGQTQSDLALSIGVTTRSIANYESGSRRPRPEVAERIAALFELKIEDVWNMFYASKPDGIQ